MMLELEIDVPGRETYNEETNEFSTFPDTHLVLKHSLLSVSKWEAKWKVPFLEENRRKPKTNEMLLDYVRCMTITPKDVDQSVYYSLTEKQLEQIRDYMNDSMTASTFRKDPNSRRSRQVVTSELIYAWMCEFGIPFDPCERWHLSRLMVLIRACESQQAPTKKMGKGAQQREWDAINKARRAAMHSKG